MEEHTENSNIIEPWISCQHFFVKRSFFCELLRAEDTAQLYITNVMTMGWRQNITYQGQGPDKMPVEIFLMMTLVCDSILLL